jgi:hypothetical protein
MLHVGGMAGVEPGAEGSEVVGGGSGSDADQRETEGSGFDFEPIFPRFHWPLPPDPE